MDREGFPPPAPGGVRGTPKLTRSRLVRRQRRHLEGVEHLRPDTPEALASDSVESSSDIGETGDSHGDNSLKSSEGDNSTKSIEGDNSTKSIEGDNSTKSIEGDNSTKSIEGDNSVRGTDTDDSFEVDIEGPDDVVIVAKSRDINSDWESTESTTIHELKRRQQNGSNLAHDHVMKDIPEHVNENQDVNKTSVSNELSTENKTNSIGKESAPVKVRRKIPEIVVDGNVCTLKRGNSGASVLVSAEALNRARDMSGRPSSGRVQSAERYRRVASSPRTASSPRGIPRTLKSPRDQLVTRASTRSPIGKNKSPRDGVDKAKSPRDDSESSPRDDNNKLIRADDASLRLALGSLNDSEDSEENMSPRKERAASPRKGLMSTTKSFEAKTSLLKRRESDGVLIKTRSFVSPLQRHDSFDGIKSPENVSGVKAVVKFDLNRNTNSNDIADTVEDKVRPQPSRLIRRTSSGRKLPIPVEKRINSMTKSESENSFLSIRKDGSTEYVALDLADNIFVQNKATQIDTSRNRVNNVIPNDKSSVGPSETNMEIMLRRKYPGTKPNTKCVGVNTESSRTNKDSKPPLERKSSRGGIIPPSPRGGVPSSPRKNVTASGKGNSPRAHVSPRTQGSPRNNTTSKPGVKDNNTRRSSIERKHSIEKIKHIEMSQESFKQRMRKNSEQENDLVVNGEITEHSVVKTQGSGGGKHSSPRAGTGSKGLRAIHGAEGQGGKGPEEPRRVYTWHEDCQGLELKEIIDTYSVIQDNTEARSETEVQSEKTWMDAERVWLVHKGGFASASQLKGEGHGLPEGRVKIRLDHGGEVLEVDEDDVEKSNPPQLDRVEDFCLLRYLNESSCLHTVRQRYGGNLIHTYAGPSLLIVNPMQPLQIYSDKVIQMFKGCKQEDMPPHIFATAQIAYREMLNTRHDQSIVLMGRSGSGKTYNMHHVLHYLAMGAGSVGNILTVDKLSAITLLLEAFGNSRTILNTSASRFSQLTTLDFDHSGQIVSASVQVLLFEKTRVVRRPEGEPTFHVFYQLLAGVDSKLRSELQLNSLNEPNLFMTPLQKTEDKQRAAQYWSRIYAAMENVGIVEDEIRSLCSVLAAIYHLGVAGAVKGNNNKGQFARPAAAQRAATLLGISVEELARNIFSSSGTATLTRNTSVRSSPADKNAEAHTTAMEALEGFVIGLYSDVFNAIVSLINRSLSSNYRSAASIMVVDTPGFQNPATCGRQSGASFEDLCYNYTQEKLQLLFHDLTFTTPQDRYSQENIECDFEFVTTSPAAMVALIEKAPAQSLHSRSRPSSYHERKDSHDDDNVFTHTVTNHHSESHIKVKVQGHSSTTEHNQGVQRSSSSSSNQSFLSKIPVKRTSSLKSYQHLCPSTSHHSYHHGSHHGNSISDHDEVRTSTPEVRESEKKGLLWILDEEAIFPGATEDSFMDRFFGYHGEQKVRRDSLLRKASSLGNTFILNHYQGTNAVQYNASGWLKVCRENPISKIATQVLQDSKKGFVKELFNSVKAPVGGMVSGSIVGMEGSTSLRRVGSMRRTFMSGTAGLKKRSMCIQVKFQVDTIIETLRKTKCHFIHCILPQANAGLCELRNPAEVGSDKPDDILMNVPLVRSQFRGNEILESVRIHRQGFPDHILFGEFIQKFTGLIPPNVRPTPDMGEKSSVIQIVENLDIDKHNYRIGLSRVFFRAGALNRLESSRDDRVTGRITAFQAYCRAYLARKKLEKLRIQHIAISCIQKNVRKFYQIRDWDWWKLYIKVKPLLNVHRTEEELHDKEIELEQMKTKLDKIEKERNDFKQQADKLENRVVELTADLAEENTTATQASEMLETESAERMRLEKELKDVQSKYNTLKGKHEKMEMEMTQIKLWQAETLDGDLEEDDVDGGIYKEKYERVVRELGFTKKRLQQQHDEELEQEKANKRAIDKRLHEAQEENDDLRRQLTSAKKKSQKLMSEMQDSKLHLEEQLTRNNDLERKQRKFDAELNKYQDEGKTERTQREKLQRERDELSADKFSLEKEVNKLKSDLESQETKTQRLQREMADTLQSAGAKDEHSMALLKKAKADLEAKVIDQEEELDDQAGQIQQLQQTKTRLEMSLEKSRQQHMKELEEKEQEMEDLRYSTQKKLKQMDSQMEEEYEERKLQQQKTRDLEQQLMDYQGQAALRDRDAEKKIRRDLRRTKALLKDAQVVIQKQKTGEGSKMAIRQLRNQLEDAEFSSAAAVKAKKTMELELADLQQQLDELFKSKQDAENKVMVLLREKTEIQSQQEENEEDMADLMKKYKAVVQQQTVSQITMNDQLSQIEELTTERDKLKIELNEMRTKVQNFEENSVDKTVMLRMENKVRDLEARLDLETTSKHRLEVQNNRTKEQFDKMTEEKETLTSSKAQSDESTKRVQRQLRDLRDEFSDVQKKEMEAAHKAKEAESRLAELETDLEQNQSDLKLAFKRISDLQSALEDGIDSEDEDDLSDSLDDSGSDIDSFLVNHKRSPLVSRRRGSLELDTRSRLESASSYLTDTPSSPRYINNIDHSDA